MWAFTKEVICWRRRVETYRKLSRCFQNRLHLLIGIYLASCLCVTLMEMFRMITRELDFRSLVRSFSSSSTRPPLLFFQIDLSTLSTASYQKHTHRTIRFRVSSPRERGSKNQSSQTYHDLLRQQHQLPQDLRHFRERWRRWADFLAFIYSSLLIYVGFSFG